jgi:hypothetical protein
MQPKFIHSIQVGNFNYVFRLTERNNLWRIYILKRIENSQFPISLSTCHMLIDEFNHYYVCWTDPITSIDDARYIADQWAVNYHHYVHSGEDFKFR